jgi:uncharacterized protein YndB with AHSA1/START domain
MPVTDIITDENNLSLTIIADFPHPVARVWQAYTDPRQLERFWGPPTYAATFTEWDHRVGGRALYHMTGPRGEKSYARWDFLEIEPERSFAVADFFADETGTPTPGMPTMRMDFVFEPTAEGTRLTAGSAFDSREALRTVLQMGVVEGTSLAMGQIDGVLAGVRERYAGRGAEEEILTDTLVRITRAIDAPAAVVWRAQNDPELIPQWMLGPDGWSMTACETPAGVGQPYRFAWAPDPGVEGEPFGFEGELLLSREPVRAVTTERMAGTGGPTTVNDLTLFEEDGATLITTVIEYPDAATRDMILGTGMVQGMEASYVRLERLLAGR